MNIDFSCKKCEGGFEIEGLDLIEGTEKLECPHCGAKVSQSQADDFTAALGELVAQMKTLSKKFGSSLSLDSEEVEVDDDIDEPEEEDDEDEDDDDEDEDDIEEESDEV